METTLSDDEWAEACSLFLQSLEAPERPLVELIAGGIDFVLSECRPEATVANLRESGVFFDARIAHAVLNYLRGDGAGLLTPV